MIAKSDPGAVSESRFREGGVVVAADISPPRMPPATGDWRSVGDVRIKIRPTNACPYKRPEGSVKNAVRALNPAIEKRITAAIARIMAPKCRFENLQPRILQPNHHKVITIDDPSQGRRFAVTLTAAGLVFLPRNSINELNAPIIFPIAQE